MRIVSIRQTTFLRLLEILSIPPLLAITFQVPGQSTLEKGLVLGILRAQFLVGVAAIVRCYRIRTPAIIE
ncbi:hypothetical protein EDD16DRAFT_1554303 [Pisolithus croceorrhizus]|nr:hypothetical protein EDD16DRAFT_1554303 [Pisolithus croceorrhizus]